MAHRKIPHGYGSVTPLKGRRSKKFMVRLPLTHDMNGNSFREVLGYYKTYNEGYDALMAYHSNPFKIELKDITFSKGYELWLYEKEHPLDPETALSDSSLNCYKAAYNWTTPIQFELMKDINKLDIINLLKKCTKGPNTKKYIKMLISQVFDFVIDLNGPVTKNPAKSIKMTSSAKSDKHKPFTEDEIDILWSNLHIPFVKEILISIYTSQRPQEMIKMHKSKFLFEENYFRNGIKTKAGINRIIPIHPRIRPFLLDLYNNTDDYLIYNRPRIAMRYEYYADCFEAAMKKLNMDHLPHDCRHTFATLADYYNMNSICKKMILGHAQLNVTDGVYTHKTIEMLYESILVIP